MASGLGGGAVRRLGVRHVGSVGTGGVGLGGLDDLDRLHGLGHLDRLDGRRDLGGGGRRLLGDRGGRRGAG
ncbi:hypothetical protein DLJ96_19955, partial [Actinotalea fermentans ATCC 43279 = JCM 9966 = DSM 3133]